MAMAISGRSLSDTLVAEYRAHRAVRLLPLTEEDAFAATFFLAELGDKTMLAAIVLASQQRALVPVWLGSSLGMVAADGIAVLLGTVAGRHLPERPIRNATAAIFILTGLVVLGGTLLGRPD